MIRFFFCLTFISCGFGVYAQYQKEFIQTNVVLNEARKQFKQSLMTNVIGKTFSEPLDSNTEYRYESACHAASQFMLATPQVRAGFDTLFLHYPQLEDATKQALLEAVYGLFPQQYNDNIKRLFASETNPKLFAMQAVYLFQNDSLQRQAQQIILQLRKTFGAASSLPVLSALQSYIQNNGVQKQSPTPSLNALFAHQAIIGRQMIYSFQRWNRDYPGIAIVQHSDGSFARDSAGQLLMFRQLARSSSNLPYFITAGNTPQGIYSVQSPGISHNKLIGPTPNLQLLLPFENNSLYFHQMPDSSATFWQNYALLLPAAWRNYLPMQEALQAGAAGRTAIIAHGSTIDPDYFKDKPFYPLTPTLGCLCARENWNTFTGKLVDSDQFAFVNTYLAREEDEAGYLLVINIDNKQAPVSKEEIEKLVIDFVTNR